MAHGTVNHTYNYVDPDTGVHTNTIEGTWNDIKLNTNRRHYNRNSWTETYTPSYGDGGKGAGSRKTYRLY